MSIYSYKAIDEEGSVVKGKIAADSEMELESKLKQSGYDLISAKISREFTLFSAVTNKEVALMCIHLHHLESAGVPILESIGDLRDSAENPKLKQIMMEVYDSLKNGKTLSEAANMHPTIFDTVFIGLLRAGEKSGDFSEIFAHLEHHYIWVDAMARKIKKAVSYPIFLLFLLCVVTSLMMIFVIPKVTVFLTSQNIELPVYTKALIATSSFFSNYWYILLITPITMLISIKIAQKSSENFAYLIDKIKLKTPFVGSLIRKIELARFCHFFAVMYSSGINILECLEVSKTVVSNRVIIKAITDIKDKVINGKKLTVAITEAEQFPSLIIKMFKVGEDSGNLDKSLQNISVFYDAEINTSIDAMVASMQPFLTFVMGGLLMWITASVFGPVYGSFSNK